MKGKLCWLACACIGAAASGFGQDVGSIRHRLRLQQTSGNKDAFASQYDSFAGRFP